MDPFTRPGPHGRFTNWLGPETVQRLLDYARINRPRFKPAVMNTGSGLVLDKSLRVAETLSLPPKFMGEVEARVRECLPEMFSALGVEKFEPGEFEIGLVAHGEGAFLKRHVDDINQRRPGGRKVSSVYYFYRTPKAFSGGQLRLHGLRPTGQSGHFVDVEPENDMLLYFPSWFPHEVLPVSCPSADFMDARFAINCWIHDKG
jgi:Rps23 Pro-64 3,4-dihydroxylase Tpa1-like proline 4-hydroxylase